MQISWLGATEGAELAGRHIFEGHDNTAWLHLSPHPWWEDIFVWDVTSLTLGRGDHAYWGANHWIWIGSSNAGAPKLKKARRSKFLACVSSDETRVNLDIHIWFVIVVSLSHFLSRFQIIYSTNVPMSSDTEDVWKIPVFTQSAEAFEHFPMEAPQATQ